MPRKLPNFIHGAIYRSKSGLPDASASAPRFNCYMPASVDISADAYVADCWVCDRFGRVDPGLSASPIPVRKEDLGRIINTQSQAQRM
jgi:hypothetical protein